MSRMGSIARRWMARRGSTEGCRDSILLGVGLLVLVRLALFCDDDGHEMCDEAEYLPTYFLVPLRCLGCLARLNSFHTSIDFAPMIS